MSFAPFEYVLPQSRIALRPPRVRGSSRLLVLDRQTHAITDRRYADLPELLRPDDLVIINNTRVIKARLIATLPNGARRELFLAEKHATPLLSQTARVLHRGKLRPGDVLTIGQEGAEVIDVFEGGEALIRATVPPLVLAERYGQVPLPPYLKRTVEPADRERYQTTFARADGSVAAPTASLNLTPQILAAMKAKGVTVTALTLHVGRGTFMPIRDENIERHTMHTEYYSIPQATVRLIRQALRDKRRIIAIGTTVTRALEHAADGLLSPESPARGDRLLHSQRLRGEADIFIRPGYEFQIISGLVTNFHAPDSTVLQLAAAFAGPESLATAYTHALAGPYHFLSYGDSMLIA